MNTLLTSVDERQPELVGLLDGLNDLSTSVVGQNDQLVSLLDQGKPHCLVVGSDHGRVERRIRSDRATTRKCHRELDCEHRRVQQTSRNLPQFADAANRIGSYGSFISLYLCNFTLKAGDMEANIFGPTHSPVCS